MLNLLPAMREIDKKRDALKMAYDQQMAAYNNAYKVLFDMNEACPHCDGEGKVLRKRACAEDDRPDPNDPRDWNTCPHCGGTGIAKKNEQPKGGEVDDFKFY